MWSVWSAAVRLCGGHEVGLAIVSLGVVCLVVQCLVIVGLAVVSQGIAVAIAAIHCPGVAVFARLLAITATFATPADITGSGGVRGTPLDRLVGGGRIGERPLLYAHVGASHGNY